MSPVIKINESLPFGSQKDYYILVNTSFQMEKGTLKPEDIVV